jgi:ATP-dependent RNA helicase DeaD
VRPARVAAPEREPEFLERPKRESRIKTFAEPSEALPVRKPRSMERDAARGSRNFSPERPAKRDAVKEVGMETYRVAVGSEHQVKPGNIVGAIANEAGIDSKHIGRIEIFDTYSLVDLPEGMPKEILQHLKKVWVAGQELRITLKRPGAPEVRTENSRYPAKSSRPERGKAQRFDRKEERPRRTLGIADRGAPRERSAGSRAGGKKVFSKGAPRGRR